MKYGAIDIGTNSCRLLIAELEGELLTPVYSELQTTRIGEGLHHSGIISEVSMERNLLCLSKFRNTLQAYGVNNYRAIATSAVREAGNGQEFAKLAAEQSQIAVDIVSGEEEARLSYLGVEKGLNLGHPPLVADLGGGSIEFICNEQEFVLSIPLGAVRATELNMSVEEISQRLDRLEGMANNFREHPLVFVGGSASSLAAIQLGLETFESSQVHGQRLSQEDLAELHQLLEKTPLNLRRRIPGLQPERADIIVQGALIILMTLHKLGKAEMIVSESDLLQGIIWSTGVLV